MKKLPYTFSKHAIAQCQSKGFSLSDVESVILTQQSHPSLTHPGQIRYTGKGLAIMVDLDQKKIVTVYLDRVFTPLRPDQVARGEKIQRTR